MRTQAWIVLPHTRDSNTVTTAMELPHGVIVRYSCNGIGMVWVPDARIEGEGDDVVILCPSRDKLAI